MIWGGWYGSRNVGDQAVLLGIARMLAQHLGRLELVVLTQNPGHVLSYLPAGGSLEAGSPGPYGAVSPGPYGAVSPSPYGAVSPSPYGVTALSTARQPREVMQALKTSQLFIFGGAVPFFQQPKQLLAMGGLTSLARLYRVPYMTWSVSSQQVTSRLASLVFRGVLSAVAGLTCRDAHTQQLFADCGRPGVPITADPVFGLPVDYEAAATILQGAGVTSSSPPLAALTPRTLRHHQREAGSHYILDSSQPLEREIELYAAALDWLWEQGLQPLFVPMHTVPPDDDRIAARLISEKAVHGSHALLVEEPIPPQAAAGVYSACRLALVSRVHGSATAAMGACPLAAYIFSPKQSGMLASLGMTEYALTPQSTAADVPPLLERLLGERECLQEFLQARLAALARDAHTPALLAAEILGYPRRSV